MKTLIASIQKDLLAVLVNRDLMEMESFAKVRNWTSLFLAFQLQLEGFEGGEGAAVYGCWCVWNFTIKRKEYKKISMRVNEFVHLLYIFHDVLHYPFGNLWPVTILELTHSMGSPHLFSMHPILGDGPGGWFSKKNAINTVRRFLSMHQISTNVLWNLNLAMKMLTAGTLMDLTLVLVKRGTVETAPYAKVMERG